MQLNLYNFPICTIKSIQLLTVTMFHYCPVSGTLPTVHSTTFHHHPSEGVPLATGSQLFASNIMRERNRIGSWGHVHCLGPCRSGQCNQLTLPVLEHTATCEHFCPLPERIDNLQVAEDPRDSPVE